MIVVVITVVVVGADVTALAADVVARRDERHASDWRRSNGKRRDIAGHASEHSDLLVTTAPQGATSCTGGADILPCGQAPRHSASQHVVQGTLINCVDGNMLVGRAMRRWGASRCLARSEY